MQTVSEIRDRLSNVHSAATFPEAAPDRSIGAGAAPGFAADQAENGSAILQHVQSPRLPDLVELILKDRPRLERIIRDPSFAADLIPRFLAVSLIGFTLFGFTLALIIKTLDVQPRLAPVKSLIECAVPELIMFVPKAGLGAVETAGAALRLITAYDLGLIAAAGVCLPSLYFYGLLAGVEMSLARVTVHTVKAMSTTAVALVGILPIYAAFGLGAAVFDAPRLVVDSVLWLGLVLPFAAGLFGVNSLYTGFIALADALPADCRGKRACFLRRLVVSWAVCYTAVTPVMIYTLWEYFSRTAA